jgi:glycosyltransferase involved in cell wall biosynthesis
LHNSAESFPNSLLEAMACEKPVIGTNVHGIPEMVYSKINGLLIPEKSSKAITKSITYFIENPKELKRMGNEGEKLVNQKFRKEIQIQKLYNTIKKIVD